MRAALKGRVPAFTLGLFVSLAALADSTTIDVGDGNVTAVTGATTLDFPVARSGDLLHDVYVDWHTEDGTALAGAHYAASSGRLRIPAGDSSAQITVPVYAGSGADASFGVVLDRAGAAGASPTFNTPLALAVSGDARAQIVADINGDGRPDVISPTGAQVIAAINVTLAGDPAVAALPHVLPIPGVEGMWLAAGDFNADGKLDLAASSDLSPTIDLYRNTGTPGSTTPSFAAAFRLVKPAVPSNPQSRNIAVGDLNTDGLPDLVSWHRDALYSFLNTTARGSASLEFAEREDTCTCSAVVHQRLADVNGDGWVDLLQLHPEGLSVWVNATFPFDPVTALLPPVDFAGPDVTAARSRYSVAVADFDGDGRQDLAYGGSYPGAATVMVNRVPAGEYLLDSSMFVPASTSVDFAEQVDGIDVTDTNGDGKADLLAWYTEPVSIAQRSQVLVNITPPGGAPGFENRYLDAAAMFRAVDFNTDGKPDLLDVDGGVLTVRVNTTPAPAPLVDLVQGGGFVTGTAPRAIALADFNGDGVTDVMLSNSGSDDLSLFLNETPAGAAMPALSAEVVIPTGPEPYGLVIADFNSDGLKDAAVADHGCETVTVAFNLTLPGSGPVDCDFFPFSFDTGLGSFPAALAAGDLNNDGLADIVAANSGTADLSVLVASTPSGFEAPQSVALGFTPNGVAVGDVNRDGRLDLVASLPAEDRVAVLLNTTIPGSTVVSFGTGTLVDVGDDPQAVAVGDVNGDQAPDLVTANLSGSVSAVVSQTAVNAATPVFATQASFAVPGARGVALGDVDGDGRVDIAVASAGDVGLLLNDGTVGSATASFAPLQAAAVGTALYGVALGDLNGDGKPDLAVADFGANAMNVLFNTQFQANLGVAGATGTISYGTAGAPAVTAIEGVNASPTSDSLVSFRVDFTEMVTGVDASDFAVVTTGVSGASLDSVVDMGASWLVTVDTGSGSGTVRLDLVDDDSIAGAFSALPLGGAGTGNGDATGPTYAIDRSGPSVDIVRAPGQVDPANTQPVHFIATFSEAVVDFEDYPLTVFVGGEAAKVTASDSTGGGTTYDLYVSGIRANGSVAMVLLGGEAHDAFGNASAAASSSETVAYNGIPDVPANPEAATGPGGGQISLSWDAATGATSYNVYEGSSPIPVATGVAGTTYVVSGLGNDTEYFFRVTAVSASGESADSAVASAVTYDQDPDAFDFVDVTTTTPGAVVTSGFITPAGYNFASPISIGGHETGTYRIPPSVQTDQPGTILPGQRVRLRVVAPQVVGQTRSVTLTIGDVTTTWSVTSAGSGDTTPDAFSFVDVPAAPPDDGVTSLLITITGFDSPAAVTISGHKSASYRIPGQLDSRDPGTLLPGQRIRVRLRSSPNPLESRTATLTVGGVSTTWTVTTEP